MACAADTGAAVIGHGESALPCFFLRVKYLYVAPLCSQSGPPRVDLSVSCPVPSYIPVRDALLYAPVESRQCSLAQP